MKSNKNSTSDSYKIETTLGDLISAICDAAEEAHVAERDVATVTQRILENLFDNSDCLL
jgi:hypothetical protein